MVPLREFCALVEPHYPQRPPVGVELCLVRKRLLFLAPA